MTDKEKEAINYWEQIMTKDKMTIEEAIDIIDDMFQDRHKIMSQKTETGIVIDLGKMDNVQFTNLEFASVIALREVQSLQHKLQKQQKEIEKKDKIIDELVLSMAENHCSIKNIVHEEICDNKCVGNNNWSCYKCIKNYFEKKVEEE